MVIRLFIVGCERLCLIWEMKFIEWWMLLVSVCRVMFLCLCNLCIRLVIFVRLLVILFILVLGFFRIGCVNGNMFCLGFLVVWWSVGCWEILDCVGVGRVLGFCCCWVVCCWLFWLLLDLVVCCGWSSFVVSSGCFVGWCLGYVVCCSWYVCFRYILVLFCVIVGIFFWDRVGWWCGCCWVCCLGRCSCCWIVGGGLGLGGSSWGWIGCWLCSSCVVVMILFVFCWVV